MRPGARCSRASRACGSRNRCAARQRRILLTFARPWTSRWSILAWCRSRRPRPRNARAVFSLADHRWTTSRKNSTTLVRAAIRPPVRAWGDRGAPVTVPARASRAQASRRLRGSGFDRVSHPMCAGRGRKETRVEGRRGRREFPRPSAYPGWALLRWRARRVTRRPRAAPTFVRRPQDAVPGSPGLSEEPVSGRGLVRTGRPAAHAFARTAPRDRVPAHASPGGRQAASDQAQLQCDRAHQRHRLAARRALTASAAAQSPLQSPPPRLMQDFIELKVRARGGGGRARLVLTCGLARRARRWGREPSSRWYSAAAESTAASTP